MRRSSRTALQILAFTIWHCGCSSGPETACSGKGAALSGDTWHINRECVEQYFAAVGVAAIVGKEPIRLAQKRAEADGRAKLYGVLRAILLQMVENWSNHVGNFYDLDSLPHMVHRGFIPTDPISKAVLHGAVPARYKETNTNVYVLMVLKDPATWTKNTIDSIEELVRENEMPLKPGSLEQDIRAAEERFREEQVEAAKAKQRSFQKALGEDDGGTRN